MTVPTVSYGDQTIPYKINIDEKRTTRVAIHVDPDGSVIVDAPTNFTCAAIHTAVQKRARWVVTHVNEAKGRLAHVRSREYVSGEQIMYLGRRYVLKVISTTDKPKPARLKGNRLEVEVRTSEADNIRGKVRAWYRVKARDYFARKIVESSQRLPWIAEVPAFRLLDMSKQWGSCSAEGQIILNTHLIKAPRNCIEYVILHELAHLKHLDHGRNFWNLVDTYMPEWPKAKRELDILVEVLTSD